MYNFLAEYFLLTTTLRIVFTGLSLLYVCHGALPFSADVGLSLATEEELGPGCCSELTQDLFRPLLESTLAGLCTYSWASSLLKARHGVNWLSQSSYGMHRGGCTLKSIGNTTWIGLPWQGALKQELEGTGRQNRGSSSAPPGSLLVHC